MCGRQQAAGEQGSRIYGAVIFVWSSAGYGATVGHQVLIVFNKIKLKKSGANITYGIVGLESHGKSPP